MRADGCQLLWQPVTVRPSTDRAPPGVSDWGLAGPGANPLRCALTGAGTQDMAIREASPLGYDSTLPAGGDRRGPRVCQESGPPPERTRYPARPRRISLPSDQGVFSKVAERSASIGRGGSIHRDIRNYAVR